LQETMLQRKDAPTPAASTSSASTSTSRSHSLDAGGFAAQEAALRPTEEVQRKGPASEKTDVASAAATGISGAGGAIPHAAQIQKSFGAHDVGNVQAHTGPEAAQASESIGAEAYASGNHIAFKGEPSLHTAAHEAAHVVQQRAGVSLSGGVGAAGDAYECHADAVADAVVAGGSAEALLDQHAGAGDGSSAVQREESKGAPKDEPKAAGTQASGLTLTGGGVLGDWALAVTAVAQKWNRIESRQVEAASDAVKKMDKDDPPPVWVGLLKTALTIGIGAVTGGIGAVIVGGLTNAATKAMTTFIVNAAVEAGKGVVTSAANAGVDKAFETESSNGLEAYRIAGIDAIGNVVNTESELTSLKMDALTKVSEAERWKGMQDIYNSLEASRSVAYHEQYAAMIEGWMSTVAKNEYGTRGQGTKDTKDDTTNVGAMDLTDTSHVGTIGIRLQSQGNPMKALQVAKVEIDGSKGNNEEVRKYLLNSPKTLDNMKVPKTVLASAMPTAGRSLYGSFFIGWDEGNTTNMESYGGAQLDDDNDNAGRSWVAMYGMNVNRDLSEREVNANKDKGVAQVRRDVLMKTFKQLGVSEIRT